MEVAEAAALAPDAWGALLACYHKHTFEPSCLQSPMSCCCLATVINCLGSVRTRALGNLPEEWLNKVTKSSKLLTPGKLGTVGGIIRKLHSMHKDLMLVLGTGRQCLP